MGGPLPRPATIGDIYLAALVDRLDGLTQLLNDRLPASAGGQPALDEEVTVHLDLTEPAQAGTTNTAEASTGDSGDVPLTEPKPRKTARKRASAKE